MYLRTLYYGLEAVCHYVRYRNNDKFITPEDHDFGGTTDRIWRGLL
jgi:hypothetical protein